MSGGSGSGAGRGFSFSNTPPNFTFGTAPSAAPTRGSGPPVRFAARPVSPSAAPGAFARLAFGPWISPPGGNSGQPPLFSISKGTSPSFGHPSSTNQSPVSQSQPANFTSAPVSFGTSVAAPTAQQPVRLSTRTSAIRTAPANPTASAPPTTLSTRVFASKTPVSSAPAPTSQSTTLPAATVATGRPVTPTTTTTASTASPLSQLNFRQLQELLNKWTTELGKQEKAFVDQATKVNSWDKTVMANGEKIAALDEAVSKVKAEHTRLEHTLDYLNSQQQEFEANLDPLEASLQAMNIEAEPERKRLHTLVDNMDTALQRISEDLKQIILYINDSNKTVDSSDPVSQILKILNEHTDALQYVEDNSKNVKKSLDQLAKMHQIFQKDNERNLKGLFKH